MKRQRMTNFRTLILFIVLANMANAQNIIRPKIECPNNIYVNAYNGVLFHQRTDLSIPTRGADLAVVFYYNSIYNDVNYGYGNGWTLGIEMRYIPDSTGVTIEQGNGRRDRYARYGNSFLTPSGVFSTLTKNGSTYQLADPDGTRYIFDDPFSKCVTQIVDRNNNSIALTYTGYHLTAISDDAGRSILLQWTGEQMTQVSTSFNSWTWSYQYSGMGNLVQVTDPNGNNSHYGYSADKRIATLSDAEGNATYITYNANDHYVTRVKTDLSDRAIHYDLANRVTTVVDYMTDDVNQFTDFRWDAKGRVTSIGGSNATTMSRYEYDNSNNIIRQVDGNGNATTFTYDNNGHLLTATDAQNHTVRYTYANYGRLASYTDQLGHQHQFVYDANGNLTTYRDPLNLTTTYSYNSHGQVISTTDPLNHTTTYTYDTYGNLASITDPLNHTTTYNYSPAGQISSLTKPNQGQYTFNFDCRNNVTLYANPLNQVTRLQYDSRGNLSEVIDPMNHSYSFQYNGVNEVSRIVNPRGDSAIIHYNNRILPRQSIDFMGNSTRYVYDSRSRLKAVVDALGDTTFLTFDGVNNIARLQLRNGCAVDYIYDELNRLVMVKDQVDTLAIYAYDAAGRVVASTNEAGATTTYTYNARGELIQVADGLGHSESYTYDAAGNLTAHTDALNHTTTYSYDAANRLAGKTDALGNAEVYSYDANGNVVSVTDANGNATQYSYDANNQLTQILFANGTTRQFSYNAAGKMSSYTNESGETLNFTYDENGNLIGKSGEGYPAVSYTRDAMGRITAASTPSHTVSFTYDALGRVTNESAGSASTHAVYNLSNSARTLTYPGGRTIVDHYDVRGNLTSQSEGNLNFATYSYLASGNPLAQSFANNTSTTFSYNDADILSGITATPQILNLQNTFDAAGNLQSRVDGVNANRSENYSYDNANRLTEYKIGAASGVNIPNPLSHIQYVLDAVGNRTSVTEDGIATTYAKNAMNQYVYAGNNVFQYDAKGNLTSDGVHYYTYDVENRLVSVDGGATATYAYDALGRRIRKTTSDGTIYYFYDGNNLIEERDAQGNTTVTYVYANGIDQVVQMSRGNDTYYYHVDGLGSVMAVTNASGAVVERYSYDPYGTPTIYDASGYELSQSAIQNRMLFTGREYDAESGLYHYRARSLQPDLGRFNQTDPLLFVDDMNLYSYVGNMPTAYIDPMGMSRKVNWGNVLSHAGDAAGGIAGTFGDLGKLPKVPDAINDAMNILGSFNAGADAGTSMALGNYADAGLTVGKTSLDIGIGIAQAAGKIAAKSLAADLVALYGAAKIGWAIGQVIDDIWGQDITDYLWKKFGDKDEDIKATGVYPRFPEPCGGNTSTNKKLK